MLLGHTKIQKVFEKLAAEGKLSHAYLFYGPEGVGKFTFAKALANYLETGEFIISNLILNDAFELRPNSETGAVGIDSARAAKVFLSQRPNRSPYRTLILDQAETLTPEAQNALLKIAEEPNPSGLLILITHDSARILPALRSRLQPIYFAPAKIAELSEWLAQNQSLPKAKAVAIALEVQGVPGLAMRFLGDTAFQARLASAKEFLRLAPAARKVFLKDLVEPDDFNLDAFLSALIMVSHRELYRRRNFAAWHELLKLRRDASYLNLNPRLQLSALSAMLNF